MSKKSKNKKISKKAAAERRAEDTNSLQGWPGYRTREGRSGLDPMDSRAEAGHISGVLIREFFTFQLKTKNPIHLILLGIMGLLLVLPFIAVVSETMRGNPQNASAWIFFTLIGIIGLPALANLIKNLIR